MKNYLVDILWFFNILDIFRRFWTEQFSSKLLNYLLFLENI